MPNYTLSLSSQLDKYISAEADNDETTKAEVIRRALGVYAALKKYQDEGKEVVVEDPNNKSERKTIIFR
jgi:hypothetical protein